MQPYAHALLAHGTLQVLHPSSCTGQRQADRHDVGHLCRCACGLDRSRAGLENIQAVIRICAAHIGSPTTACPCTAADAAGPPPGAGRADLLPLQ